jgi:hypothetical protein
MHTRVALAVGKHAGAAAVKLAAFRGSTQVNGWRAIGGRGLHYATFQLNLSALHDIGGARWGCLALVKGVLGVFMVWRGLFCVRHGSS